jgi:mannose-6-phosphate isomerase-like protein (cupin superfamily)
MPVITTNPIETSQINGADYGATICLILDYSDPGNGPRLHRHPYDETWVVVEGQVAFQAGEEGHQVGPGDVVIVPAGVAHKFTSEGPGPSRLVCIHANPTVIGEWPRVERGNRVRSNLPTARPFGRHSRSDTAGDLHHHPRPIQLST